MTLFALIVCASQASAEITPEAASGLTLTRFDNSATAGKGDSTVVSSLESRVLYMTRRATPTISHEEMLSADSVEFARHNRERYESLTAAQKLFYNISSWTPWNVSNANTNATKSKVNAKFKDGL